MHIYKYISMPKRAEFYLTLAQGRNSGTNMDLNVNTKACSFLKLIKHALFQVAYKADYITENILK